MSNQVYSSPQHKYFAQPGVTVWARSGDQNLVPAADTTIAFVDPPLFNQGNVSFLDRDPDGSFTALDEGLYYFSLTVQASMPNPADDLLFETGLALGFGNGAASGQILARWKGAFVVSLPVQPYCFVTVSTTVYLPQGGIIRAYIIDNSSADLTLRAAETQLQVTKVA